MGDTATGFPAAELVAPSSVSLAGPLFRAQSGSTISALNHLLFLGRSSLTSTSPNALIQIADSSVSLGGLDPFSNTIVAGRLINLSGTAAGPGLLALQGPLFTATGSQVTTTSEAFGVFAGGHLVAALTTAPPDLPDGR